MLPSVINTTLDKSPHMTILTAAYDNTVSFGTGASEGPEKIMECLHSQIEIFDRVHKQETTYKYNVALEDMGYLNEDSAEIVAKKIEAKYKLIREKCPLVFMIGGEHSVSIGALSAIKDLYIAQDVTILQIDAHLDLRNDDSDYRESPTKFAHSAVMRRAHEFGFNIITAGTRIYSKEEYEYSKKNNIQVFEWGQQVPSVSEIISSIKTKKVYLTIDADGFDPSVMPGTGTPVQGGLGWYYFFELLEALFEKEGVEIIGADFVEVAPQEDTVINEFNAAQIIYTIMGYLQKGL